MIHIFSDSKPKDGMKAEIQSVFRTLPTCHTRQRHGNPPGLNKPPCQQTNYRLNDIQQNKGEEDGHKSQHAKTDNDQFVVTQVSCL